MAAYSIPIVRPSADLDGTSKRAYQLQSVEKYQQSDAKGSGKIPSLVIQTADIRTVADLFSYVKQKDKQFHPKPASKVVNDDSTPMVVYHGTSDTFWAFDVTEISHLEGNFSFVQKKSRVHCCQTSPARMRQLFLPTLLSAYARCWTMSIGISRTCSRRACCGTTTTTGGRRESWARAHCTSGATTPARSATCSPMLRTAMLPTCAGPSPARAVRLSGLNTKAAAASKRCSRCFSARFQ